MPLAPPGRSAAGRRRAGGGPAAAAQACELVERRPPGAARRQDRLGESRVTSNHLSRPPPGYLTRKFKLSVLAAQARWRRAAAGPELSEAAAGRPRLVTTVDSGWRRLSHAGYSSR